MIKPPEIDAALAAVERVLDETTLLKADREATDAALPVLRRALAAQPERAWTQEDIDEARLRADKLRYSLGLTDACPPAQPDRALEPPDAALVASARRKLEHHPDRSGPHGGCSCVDCHAARYILRAAGRGGDDG